MAENFKIENDCAFDRTLTAEKSDYCMRTDCEFMELYKNGSHVSFKSKERAVKNTRKG